MPPVSAQAIARARRRNRDHLKRVALSDITAGQELAMRKRTRKCKLCGVFMTSKPGRPNSKHLDHIVPVNIGGTHTHGNVRITCQACNVRRPKDGSDYSGPVTLWAQEPGIAARRRALCRNGLHPWIPENIVLTGRQNRCKRCLLAANLKRHPLQTCKCGKFFVSPGATLMCPACTDAAARKAAELHAAGALTWKQVAELVGYGSGEGARYAAKRIGYTPAPRPPAPRPEPARCACGVPLTRTGRPNGPNGSLCCEACFEAMARRAVHLRTEEGWTLRMIADELGYRSITSVSNTMKRTAEIEMRIGQPSSLVISS
jgi:hypothetical protein